MSEPTRPPNRGREALSNAAPPGGDEMPPATEPEIPIAGPWITQREIDYVTDAATNGWYANANAYPERFERCFAAYLGVRHAVSLPSCTSAIHLALAALDIGPGDEVIVPDVTWIASAAPISYVGATPVFADIDRQSWCLSPASFAECVTPRTKAVVPVHLYGNVADMGVIREIADRHGVAVIEDAAEAIGAEYGDRKAGGLGDIGTFSFHGSKTVTTGEGGMLVTDSDDVRERVRFLRDHGRPAGDRMFWNTEVAYKYKMSAVQAALGLAQIERVAELVARKREVFAWYAEQLADLDGVSLNFEAPGTKGAHWMVTALIAREPPVDKRRLVEAMQAKGVACRPFFWPLSSLPAYASSDQALQAQRRNHVSYEVSPKGINLPSALSLNADTVARVCSVLRALLAEG